MSSFFPTVRRKIISKLVKTSFAHSRNISKKNRNMRIFQMILCFRTLNGIIFGSRRSLFSKAVKAAFLSPKEQFEWTFFRRNKFLEPSWDLQREIFQLFCRKFFGTDVKKAFYVSREVFGGKIYFRKLVLGVFLFGLWI